MEKVYIISIVLALFALGGLSAQQYEQPWIQDGGGYSSAYDPANSVDYEMADNFSGLTDPITSMTFYGMPGKFENNWLPNPPAAIEPFFVKFYEYQTGLLQDPVPTIMAPMTGTYTAKLYDSYGDGWDSGSLDVYVNGILVLDAISCSAEGPEPYTFSATTGDEITTIFSPGNWPHENWYEILDPENTVIAQDGDNTNNTAPTGIPFTPTPQALEPTWDTPFASFSVDATTSYVTDWTWGGWQLYKYEVILPRSVNLTSGWVSAQVDAVNGSGQWILWAEGSGGDSICHHRLNYPAKDRKGPEAAFARKGDMRGLEGTDMAFELYTTPANLIVVDEDGNVSGPATIVTGGEIPEGLQGPDTGAPAILYTITSTGPQDVQVFKPTQFTGDWYCWLSIGSTLYAGDNPISANTQSFTFTGIGFGVREDAVLMINDDNDVTLPVTLSGFTAVLTADLYVKIAWISESETNHAGYNVLRSEVREISTAMTVNNGIIDQGSANGTQMNYLYTDTEVATDATYYYWLESVSLNGESEYYGPLMVTVNAAGEEPVIPVIPVETKLFSAFPNPFNPSTNLRYSMKEAGDVRIEVYNVKGQILETFNNSHNQPGYYQISWDGRDANGSLVGTGLYFCRMTSGKYTSTKKMILAK